ncbi:MAG: heavy metal translocating P-type ATPase [Candidatus Odinarchaeia archaeon]
MKTDEHTHEDTLSCPVCVTNIYEKKEETWKRRGILIIIISSVLFTISLSIELLVGASVITLLFFISVTLIAGYTIIRKGVLGVFHKQVNINLLVTIAAIGAFAIGHGEEGAVIMLLFFAAEFLEDYAAERARQSISSLMNLTPEETVVLKNGKKIKLHVHQVNVNDIIISKPGDIIPLDGEIINGSTSVNQAPITGESIPVFKKKGDTVFAGSINLEGYIEIKVTKAVNETTISKIVKLVEEAQSKKSETELFIEKFAKYYTPIIIFSAILVMLIPPLFIGLAFDEWIYRGLVLLVIACPCALAISTPISMVSAITHASKNGVIIKGGEFIEKLKKTKVIVFDKTGTLTTGKLKVTDVVLFASDTETSLLEITASLESKSNHPIPKAIMEYVEARNIKTHDLKFFRYFPGKGIQGEMYDKTYFSGNKTLFNNIPTDVYTKLKSLEREGKTVILVGDTDNILGLIALMDEIKGEAYNLIEKLKSNGVHTVMLTGDNKQVARAVADTIKVDEFYAELLPEDKVRIITELSEKYGSVAMVGDGVNDAPSLAQADIGIAMGGIGSDIAIETADIVLMEDDISKINYLMELGTKTMSTIKQNIALSVSIKSIIGILAIFGLVSLWAAVGIGDLGLSLAVIINSLLIGVFISKSSVSHSEYSLYDTDSTVYLNTKKKKIISKK